jgi:DNA-binding transcriptional MerR regulator
MEQAIPLMRIGELSRRTGKTSRALHLYEEMELLTPVRRSEGGYRLYGQVNIERIAYIDRLQQAGLSLKEIKRLVMTWAKETTPRDGMAELQKEYREQLTTIRARIKNLKKLEDELLMSLGFLDGCRECTHDEQSPQTACGGCARLGEHKGNGSALITGLAST